MSRQKKLFTQSNQALVEIELSFNEERIRCEGQFICLTDLWKSIGGSVASRPKDWLGNDDVAEFMLTVIANSSHVLKGDAQSLLEQHPSKQRKSQSLVEWCTQAKRLAIESGFIKTTFGKYGATFAHWQIAAEYAVYLGGTTVKMALFKSMEDLNVILDALKDFEIPSEIKGTMYVYAIREVNSGNIKLGISRNPKARLKDLQTGNSSRLELVAFCEAKNRYQDERAVQNDNHEFHIHGEWFTGQAKLTL